jgi:cell division protein FtsB
MAHCKKMDRATCGHMFKHFERAKNEQGEYIKFGNENIDTSRSHLNYNLAPVRESQGDFVRQRCSEVKCQNRKDVNVMCSWIVTAPKDLPEQEHELFFKSTYEFLSERYGKENVVSAYVHMDELTPHMHFAFVPVVYEKKNNRYKVSAKEAIDLRELKVFHGELSAHLEHTLQHPISILNEATIEGNKSIVELKRKSAAERLIEARTEASKIITDAQLELNHINVSLAPLKAEYEAKKAYVRAFDKSSNISTALPDYAEVKEKGILKKQEFVTVPKEKWVEKHVSANEKEFLKKATEKFEKVVSEFKHTSSAEYIQELENQVNDLKNELNYTRKKNEKVLTDVIYERNDYSDQLEYIKEYARENYSIYPDLIGFLESMDENEEEHKKLYGQTI